jgi:hypothetical protein
MRKCGFDTILIGNSLENASIHWLECNGRWGGVSIPIAVASRLVGNWTRKFLIIVQRTNLSMPRGLSDPYWKCSGGYLFSPSDNQEGVVLLAPGRLIDGSGLNLMMIADTKRTAREQLEVVTRLLTK